MKPDYFSKLEIARHLMKKYEPNFPRNSCCFSSRFVKLAFDFPEIGGFYYHPKDSFYFGEREWHAWNLDPINKIYVDLSMDQFWEGHSNVEILSIENEFLSKNIWITAEQRMFSNKSLERKNKTFEDLLIEFKDIVG